MSLIHWWPLNGDLNDYGCENVNLVASGAVSDTIGKIGSCYSLAGNTDYLSVTSQALNSCFQGGSTPFSILMWIYNNEASTSDRAVVFGDYGLTGAMSFNIEINGGSASSTGLRFYWNSNPDFGINAVTVPLQTWTHIGIVYDGTDLKFYKNGSLLYTRNGTLATRSKSGAFYFGRDSRTGATAFKGKLNDIRIYDTAITQTEIRDIAKGLVLHYDFEDPYFEGTTNLGGTSISYTNKSYNTLGNLSSWGGDAGTVCYYPNGGYNDYPYKVYHKTSTGTGGIFCKTADDITIVSGKTYTFSVYVKASIEFTADAYSFNINRGSDNYYINMGKTFPITKEWTRISRTFIATDAMAGQYGEMSIIYYDGVTDYYVYYSGFQIEEKDHATPFTIGTRSDDSTIYDCSGYINNGIPYNITASDVSNSGQYSAVFNGTNSYIATTLPSCSFGDNKQITYSIWINPATVSGQQAIFGTGSDWKWAVYLNGATPSFVAWDANGSHSNSLLGVLSLTSLTVNTWYMLSFTYDGSVITGYLNGQKQNTITRAGSSVSTKALNINIGGNIYVWGSSWFNGKVSDFKVYNTVLSDNDILTLYNRKAAMMRNGTLSTGSIKEKVVSGTKVLGMEDIYGYTADKDFINKTSWADTVMNETLLTNKLATSTKYYCRYKITRLAYPVSHSYTCQAWAQFLLYKAGKDSPVMGNLTQDVYTSLIPGQSTWVYGEFTTPSSFSGYQVLFYSARWSGSSSDWGSNAECETVSISDFMVSSTPFVNQNPEIKRNNTIILNELEEKTNSTTKIHKRGRMVANEIIEN